MQPGEVIGVDARMQLTRRHVTPPRSAVYQVEEPPA